MTRMTKGSFTIKMMKLPFVVRTWWYLRREYDEVSFCPVDDDDDDTFVVMVIKPLLLSYSV